MFNRVPAGALNMPVTVDMPTASPIAADEAPRLFSNKASNGVLAIP